MDKMISVYDIKVSIMIVYTSMALCLYEDICLNYQKRMKCATFDLGLYAMCFCVCDDILFAGLRSGSIFVISMKVSPEAPHL